jgi:glycosyltransferase involved in cell wall biosynthesis
MSFPAKPHILVATPCYGGQVTSLYTLSLLGLQRACAEIGVALSFRLIAGDSLITRARNLAVQQFLATPEATHLLFIDADIGFAPEQALALLAADKDVCGAVYPLKRLDWDRIRAQAKAGIENLAASTLNYVMDLKDGEPTPPTTDFFQVKYLGTGFLMIKKTVFAKMAERYPETRFKSIHLGLNIDAANAPAHAFFDCMIDPDSGEYLSEDYTFCKRWTRIGGEIWAYANSRLAHVGTMTFEGDLAGTFKELGGA